MKNKLITSIAIFTAALLAVSFNLYARTPHTEYKNMKIAECGDCHKESKVVPNHDSDFLKDHRLLAVKGGSNCIECHEQSFCLDCHTGGGIEPDLKKSVSSRGEYMPKTHRSNFVSIHSIKAIDNPQNCYRCHENRFCESCHTKQPNKNAMKIKSHLPSGAGQSFMWNSEHGAEARRNLQSCQSCHPDGNVCMPCHSAKSGIKISPHPKNFKGDKIKSRSEKSCQVCH